MKFHKRQLILASLVVALGAAVYLNWQFSDNHGFDDSIITESAHELGEARYVNTSKIADKPDNLQSTELTTSQAKKFFAEATASRQKARDEALEKLKNLISSQTISEEAKNGLLEQSETLTNNIQKESNIENLIKAKGFGECLVLIQNDECSVIVNPGSIQENTAIVIKDIITGQSGIKSDKIKIIEAK